jgi:hypothetical protein
MKPTGVVDRERVIDEMFPEGAGPYMDIEEVNNNQTNVNTTQ